MATDPRRPIPPAPLDAPALPAIPLRSPVRVITARSVPEFEPPRKRRRRRRSSVAPVIALLAIALGIAAWAARDELRGFVGSPLPRVASAQPPQRPVTPRPEAAATAKAPEPKPAEPVALRGMAGTKEKLLAELSDVIGSQPALVERHGASETWRWTGAGETGTGEAAIVLRDLDDGYAVELSTRTDHRHDTAANRSLSHPSGSWWSKAHREMIHLLAAGDRAVSRWWEQSFLAVRVVGGKTQINDGPLEFEVGSTGTQKRGSLDLWTIVRPSPRPHALDR